MAQLPFQPIAITGMSALFPQARTLDEFWRLILSGRDCMQEVPRTHWLIEDYYDPDPKAPVKTYARKGAFLKDVAFDPVAYGIPPSTLPSTDIAQLMALMLARAVLDDASDGQIAKLKLERTSIILGVASATEMISSMSGLLTRPMWIEGMRQAGIPEPQVQEAAKRIAKLFPEWTENTFPGCLGNVVAGRVANRFNLGGTNCVTDAACASSLAALHMGISELQLGTSDRVISGGIDALNTIFMFMCFSQTPAMSASGKCSPFAQAADGTMMGEGGGMLCLRRLEDAEREGDTIHAVIRGVGSSSDGRAKSVYAPRPEGQSVALQRCYAQAGYAPATVRLVEAHGTGTAAGDLCETSALKDVFGASAPAEARGWCALGSIKSQIGHTKGAAGTAGLIKVALALRHRVLPPTANIDAPNPALQFEQSPFYLNTKPRPWIQPEGEPRRGSASSFGFGGTNFHVALEEYVGANAAPRVRAFGAEVLLASGDTAAVSAQVAAWAKLGEADFGRAAQASQQAFVASAAVRAAIVAASPEDAATKAATLLEALRSGGEVTRPAKDGIYLSRAAVPAGGVGLAYLFPGQGSQSVGMGAEVVTHFEPAMRAWEKFERLAQPAATRLSEIVFPPPAWSSETAAAQEANLRRTDRAQPALGATSLSYLAVLEAAGLKPEFAGGHSFGEVPALYAAGVIGWEDCVHVSQRRGELMAAVADKIPGAMTAVLHASDEIAALVGREFPACVIANHNAPQQVVVAGPLGEITRLELALAAKQIDFKRLPVATAFHSALVEAACVPFHAYLGNVAFVPSAVPVFSNTTAAVYPENPAAMRAALAGQLAKPVRFAEQLRAMHAAGARIFVEVGAGSVLTGLVRQTLGSEAVAIALNPSGLPADVGLLQGLARLATCGVAVGWEIMWDGHRPAAAEEKRSAATLQVGGYNLGRPYPPANGAKTPPVPTPPPAIAPVTATNAPKALTPTNDSQRSIPSAPAGAASEAVARAHETFLRTMADAHRAFLASASGAPMPAPVTSPISPAPAVPAVGATQTMAAPVVAKPRIVSPKPAVAKPAAPPPQVAVPATPVAKPAAAVFDSAAVIEVVLKTVAEKTGYPREMLEPQMLLEGDLGIDSIKRVEILSAVQKALPGLPPVDAKVMAGLQTLQAISDYLIAQLPAGGATSPAAASAEASSAIAAAPSAEVVIEIVLKTVAEKTGYPREMLRPAMLLESDLGIDSIKRVEILSAVQKQLPGLPPVDAKVMGGLQTLQAISDYLVSQLGGAPVPAEAKALEKITRIAIAASREVAEVKTESAPLPVRRYVVGVERAERCGLALPGLQRAKRIVITDDGRGVAQALAAMLACAAISAEVVAAVPADADGVILLDGLQVADTAAEGTVLAKRAFDHGRSAAAAVAGEGGFLVTVQDTGGAFGLAGNPPRRPWLGALAGLAKTAAKEWPKACARAIDVEVGAASPEAVAARLADELLRGGDEIEVGLRADGDRVRPVLLPADVASGATRVRESSVVVATGGARGVTAATLVALAQAHRPKIALLGRTILTEEPRELAACRNEDDLRQAILQREKAAGRALVPKALAAAVREALAQREVRATIAELERAGSVVRYFPCDTTDAAAMRSTLDQVRGALGPITVVLHGAGVLADKLIAEKTPEQFARVFDTKVAGLDALLAATESDPLEAVVLFSSVAGRFGNRGQADYAMANEALNKVAHDVFTRREGKCLVRSINWGPWEGGMVGPELRAHFAAQGIGVIGRTEGAEALVRELAGPARREEIEIVIGAGRLDLGASGADQPTHRAEIAVSVEAWPFLTDHVVKGKPVVPIALVTEWILAAAALARSDAPLQALRDLQVMKPLVLTGEAGERPILEVACHEHGGAGVEIRLLDAATRQVRYQARAVYGPVLDLPSRIKPASGQATYRSFGYETPGAYDGKLFHGPAFQVIAALDGWSRDAAGLTLENRELAGGPWRIGPALLDGALQAAALWTLERFGASSLPLRVGEIAFTRPLADGERCVCRLAGEDKGGLGTVSEVECIDAAGAVVLTLRGIECFHVDSYWATVAT